MLVSDLSSRVLKTPGTRFRDPRYTWEDVPVLAVRHRTKYGGGDLSKDWPLQTFLGIRFDQKALGKLAVVSVDIHAGLSLYTSHVLDQTDIFNENFFMKDEAPELIIKEWGDDQVDTTTRYRTGQFTSKRFPERP